MFFAHYYGSDYHHGSGDYLWGLLFAVLFIALSIFLVVFLARGLHKTDDNLDVAKKRYAKGEIDKKQYEEIKKELSG